MPLLENRAESRIEKVWEPTKKQDQFIEIPFTTFEALFGGAVGGGKSELRYMLPIVYGFHEKRGFHGVLFRKTFPQLEASLILRAIPIYKMLGATYDSQKHVCTFPSGAIIRFSYIESMRDALDHDTNEYQYLGFDELTGFDLEPYRYLTSRVRSLVSGVPPIIRAATNPGNIGHLWVRQRFIEPAPSGGKLVHDLESDTYRLFIKALLTDNPHLLQKDPGYIKRLKLLTEADYRAKVYGDWWVFSGQVFSEWRDPFLSSKLSDEPANACHVIDDITPPAFYPRIMACDWGFSPGRTWVGWAAVTPEGRAILYRERVWDKTNIAVWGADVARITESERESVVACKLDPSAWGHRGEAKTIAEQIIDATGLPWERADNDRIGGKLLMHEFLRWKPRPASFTPAQGYDEALALKILRNQGPKVYSDYCKLFEPESAEINLPRFQVVKSATEFRKTIPACVYAERNGIQAEDVAEFIGDDPYDCGRYLIKAVDEYTRLSSKLHTKYGELAQIVERLDKTNDWNTYHRQMAKYDREVRPSSGPIQRKRGRFRAL